MPGFPTAFFVNPAVGIASYYRIVLGVDGMLDTGERQVNRAW